MNFVPFLVFIVVPNSRTGGRVVKVAVMDVIWFKYRGNGAHFQIVVPERHS